MNDIKHGPRFWAGNLLLGLALVLLFFLGSIWPLLGNWTFGLWMILAGVGMYLVTSEKGPASHIPD